MNEVNEVDGVVMCGYFSAGDYCVFAEYKTKPFLQVITCRIDGDESNIWSIVNQYFKQSVLDAITDRST